MKSLGIILALIGVVGIAAGLYGLVQVDSIDEELDSNTSELQKMFPDIEGAGERDVQTLVDMEMALSSLLRTAPPGPKRVQLTRAQELVRGTLDGMADRDDMEMARNVGLPAGGAVMVIGLVLALIVGRRNETTQAAA